MATGAIGVIIFVLYLVFSFVIKDVFSISIISAALGVIAAGYAFGGFRFIAKSTPQKAGIISFGALLLLAIVTSITTISNGPIFFGLWVIALLFSGMFGMIAVIATLVSAVAFLALISLGVLGGETEYYELIMMPVVAVMAVVSWSGWARITKIKTGLGSLTPNKKTPSVASNLDADVLIASITEGVIVVDKQNIIRVFNKSARDITLWEENEAFGLDHHSVMVLVDDKGAVIPDQDNPFSISFETGKPKKLERGRLQNKSQKPVELDLVTSPIMGDDGQVVSVIGIFRDVSKERQEEKQRAEFISTASHEMRTPVAAIEGYLSLALNEKVTKIDSAARGYLEKAHISTQHLGKLFQDLLTAAKSEDGRLTNHPEVIEVGQFLDEIIEGVRFTAQKKGLLMEADFAGGQTQQPNLTAGAPVVRPVAYVLVDPERMREVITNLFDNAVKYTEAGKITIGMKTSDKDARITVADTGAGIPKEDVPHLFQKFYRVDNSATRQVGGTGLGLFICKKIVELYNGKIWAESEVGTGSVFIVSLPRLTPEKAQELIKQQQAAQMITPQSIPTPSAAASIAPATTPSLTTPAQPSVAPTAPPPNTNPGSG